MHAARPRIEIAIAVVEHEGRWLIGCRSSGSTLAGYWEFPGGKIEPGETPAAAAIRECHEETGARIEVIGVFPDVVHDYPHDAVHLHFLRCRFIEQQDSLPERFHWATTAELANYQFPSANAGLLAVLSSADAR